MEDALQVILERRPKAVLDAGLGFGLWGHLLRQYLDVWGGRIQPEQWTTRIDGIEIDPARVQPHARFLYSNIFIGDIRELAPRCARDCRYDVILFGDVLEHLPKADALALLRTAVALAAVLVVARIPLGNGWRAEGREEPDHHRSRWTLDDFLGFTATIRQYDYLGNPYGLVAIETGGAACSSLAAFAARLEGLEARLQQIISGSSTHGYRSS
jgi:SAM-dependent methyltransferase